MSNKILLFSAIYDNIVIISGGDNVVRKNNNPLSGKTVIFLGSSVTYGSAAGGVSFADFLEKEDGIISVKEAVSGTTLVDGDSTSYVSRMKTINKSIRADAFVCQLSTNDASLKKPLGEIAESSDIDSFDTQTVAGAIEYIISYARKTWKCPVIFYTGTKYDSEIYGEMVNLLLEIQKKRNIGVLDLWDSDEMNAVSKDDYNYYMANGIHPNLEGYRRWWTPQFRKYLISFFGGNENEN